MKLKNNYLPYIFMAPALILLFFFFALPFISTVLIGFTDFNGFSWNMKFVGMANFINIFRESEVLSSLKNTVLFTVLTLLFQIPLGLLLAVLLNRNIFGRDVFRAIFFLPAMISSVALSSIWGLIFNPNLGTIVTVAKFLGWDWLADIRWLADPGLVMYSISAVNVWIFSGWCMVIFLAGLQSIPQEMLESADLDGATPVRKLWHITLPMLAPATTINVVMVTIGGLKVFDLPLIMTNGGPGHASETLTMTIINNSFALSKVGYGAALSILMLIFILLFTYFQNKFLGRAEEATEY